VVQRRFDLERFDCKYCFSNIVIISVIIVEVLSVPVIACGCSCQYLWPRNVLLCTMMTVFIRVLHWNLFLLLVILFLAIKIIYIKTTKMSIYRLCRHNSRKPLNYRLRAVLNYRLRAVLNYRLRAVSNSL
jgi:hypothetical protein